MGIVSFIGLVELEISSILFISEEELSSVLLLTNEEFAEIYYSILLSSGVSVKLANWEMLELD